MGHKVIHIQKSFILFNKMQQKLTIFVAKTQETYHFLKNLS